MATARILFGGKIERITVVLGLGLGVDFTFTWANNNSNDKNNDNNDKNNPQLNFLEGKALGDKEHV